MKIEIEEVPKCYFERKVLFIIIWLCITVVLNYLGYQILSQPNPWGIFISILGLVFIIQGLWLILNPYILLYKNRFEIKQFFMYSKIYYYLDIKSIELQNHFIVIEYNDLSREKVSIIFLRNAHKQLMFESLIEEVKLSNLKRDF